jgi:lipoprotein-anchoring transpeptidase ErfK/SrfK
MRKILFISSMFLGIAACAPKVQNAAPVSEQTPTVEQTSPTSESLLDVASPDEVAQELGLGPIYDSTTAEPEMIPKSLTSLNRMSGIDLSQYFPVVIVVNKANVGPSAQTLKLYHRGVLAYTFAVSTGREQEETKTKSGRNYFSTTPTGFFAPMRTVEKYYSTLWQANMNNAVFFNGGIALHATTPEHFKNIGHRDSGGCVRMMPKNAKIVYDLIIAEGKGEVPVISRTGQIQMGGFRRKVITETNWNTLIIVEDNEAE